MITYSAEATSRNQVFDFDWCLDQLRSGKRPLISKITPYGDLICKLTTELDGALVAEICTEWLAPEVSNELNTLVQTAYATGLRLVILLYPQGNFNITFKDSTEIDPQYSFEI